MSYDDNDIINILKKGNDELSNKEDDKEDIQVINRDDYPFDISLDTPNNSGSNGGNILEPTGLTPILPLDDPINEIHHGEDDFNETQLISQPKLYTNLPPLQPLSDLFIPNGINLHPPAIENKPLIDESSKKRKDTGTARTKPTFVVKLWAMVNNPDNSKYIRWDDDGKSFQVFHREEFMKEILPRYFKHNQFASFVRQLNMYGWHKVQDISNGTMKDDKTNEENWKFENPYFQRGREDLLDKIQRNKSMAQETDTLDKSPNLKMLLNELDNIKYNQLAITEDLRRIRSDNKTLWQENFLARERHIKQTQTLDKILKFLATVYGNNSGKILEVEDDEVNKPGPLNLDDFNLDEISSPKPKPRLMLMNQAYKSSNATPNTRQNSTSSDISNMPSGFVNEHDVINVLEHDINQQGQSIQQVQDWIQKLSNRQEDQQQQLANHQQQIQQQIQQARSNGGFSPSASSNSGKVDLDFNVDDFLRPTSSANTPVQIEEIDEGPPLKRKKVARSADERNGYL